MRFTLSSPHSKSAKILRIFPSHLDMIIQGMSAMKERMKCSSCCNLELPSLRAGRGSSEAGRVEMFVTLGWYLSDEGREASSSRSLGRSSAPWVNNRPRGPRQQQRGVTFQKHWQLFMAREGTAHQQRCRDHAQVALTGFLLNLQQILAEFANSSN